MTWRPIHPAAGPSLVHAIAQRFSGTGLRKREPHPPRERPRYPRYPTQLAVRNLLQRRPLGHHTKVPLSNKLPRTRHTSRKKKIFALIAPTEITCRITADCQLIGSKAIGRQRGIQAKLHLGNQLTARITAIGNILL